ncbi:MAG TPA: NAD-dependent protein deacylase, partial [Candidatus Limadaptatus stercorigallinarum]|nr:NAD-dependent protein deacylase [Candidatus Limadaptatus stercorigallinarum]
MGCSEDDIIRLGRVIGDAEHIVLFTGAGFSVPSGIPDFRSAGGVYSGKFAGYGAEYMLSRECLALHPELFFDFYRSKMLYPDAKPNDAHLFFAELEKQGRLLSVVTQNIDGLHQAAGSRRVWELHGSVKRNRCVKCGRRYGEEFILSSEGVPKCTECGGTVRPCVVLYGESLDADVLDGAVKDIGRADVLIIAGTSLAVYPAAA